ncbi:ubiquitin-specific protease otu1 [Pleurotus ostreatus]|uniref:Ubiquitin thioesterase OTU n=1 Tax=Pleurotus ostreatus TaxID=5322 RepID=A0A8H7A648_PLEOS|nr:ubiquitin-specific protease otu1 [Pleurotus ostreatus]KAF7440666.1 ubiquitin-specific protease otu1 [Pleurotus ostreatus]KAJ8699949.1 ubiquitin-specific protease otu1 [Pleurotus ostreatus]
MAGVVRLRHSAGVASLQVPFDDDTFTVAHLQRKIAEVTGIGAAQQHLKAGYPPRDLHLVADLPVSSLGLRSGDQIILSAAAPPVPAASRPPQSTSAPRHPAPAPAPRPQAGGDGGPVHVATADGSFLVHRVVPDDNSCLFSSIALIFNSSPANIRQIVADAIQRDPDTYSEPILGMPPAKYTAAILRPATWGGAIELAVLAAHFATRIDSVDVETGRIDRFEPSSTTNPTASITSASGNRCILVYSGIHYDAATLAPMPDADPEWHQTVFPITSDDDASDPITVAAKQLAGILRARRQYTNTATFDLRCEQCNQGLKGEKGARAHAEQTGHTRFGEY